MGVAVASTSLLARLACACDALESQLPPLTCLWQCAVQAGGPGGGSSSGGAADLAGPLRVLLKHGRLADAAALAAQHLQHALHSVPSVGMARMTQVYFPQALLDQLVAELGRSASSSSGGAGCGASLAQERQQVAELLQRVRGAALGQTTVIQQLYAH